METSHSSQEIISVEAANSIPLEKSYKQPGRKCIVIKDSENSNKTGLRQTTFDSLFNDHVGRI